MRAWYHKEMVSPMIHRMYATAFIASLSVALTLAPSESFGRSGAAPGGKICFDAFGLPAHQPCDQEFTQISHRYGITANAMQAGHSGRQQGVFTASIRACSPRMSSRMWMMRGQYQSMSLTHMMSPGMRCIDIRQGHEYASGCRSQTVTVPRGGGKKQSVNIVRCY